MIFFVSRLQNFLGKKNILEGLELSIEEENAIISEVHGSLCWCTLLIFQQNIKFTFM